VPVFILMEHMMFLRHEDFSCKFLQPVFGYMLDSQSLGW